MPITRRDLLRGASLTAMGVPLAASAPLVTHGATLDLLITDGHAPLLLVAEDGGAAPLIARCLRREIGRREIGRREIGRREIGRREIGTL